MDEKVVTPCPSEGSTGSGEGAIGRIPAEKSLLRRFIPPMLERKHSSGDLQSRLKTRKILGVGETDNGDIHRSKISQVLGHNEHLYMRMPKGFWTWYILLLIFLMLQSITILCFPGLASRLGLLGCSNISANATLRRYYAASIFGFAFILWKFLYLNDKTVMRVVQYGMGVFFGAQLSIDAIQLLEEGLSILLETMILLMIFVRIGLCTGCVMFWKKIGSATSGLRKSPSYKDMDEAK